MEEDAAMSKGPENGQPGGATGGPVSTAEGGSRKWRGQGVGQEQVS